MELWIQILAWLIIGIPLHELGHYLIAVRLHWHPISLKLLTWHKIPYAFAVVATNHIKIESNSDFIKAYKEAATFYAMGSIFSMLGISICYTIGLFSSNISYLLTVMMAMYMTYEICGVKHKATV